MISDVDRSKKVEQNSGGSLSEGLSSQKPIDQKYEPRMSGQGGRPESPKKEKAGKFTIC